jgi:2-C-methyl-D-erythritol 4-phosphate cytidylyltransferase
VPADGSLDDLRNVVGFESVVVVQGGKSRSESVRNGLAAVPIDVAIVVVHDAARPLAPSELFAHCIGAVRSGADGAIAALAVTDTVKRAIDGVVIETVDRSALVAVQTPQAFRADLLRRAHHNGADATDDAGLIEALGGRVVVVEGDVRAGKLTTPDDLVILEAFVAADRTKATV